MKSVLTWNDGTHLPNLLGVNLNSSGISRLLDRIGESDLHRRFSKNFMYDMKTIPAYSSLTIFEYGYAKDHADLLQVNLSIAIEKRCFLPMASKT